VLPLVFALFVGRVFCGAVCPLGAIQDVFLIRPVKLPAGLSAALSVLPYVYLAVAVLYAVLGSTFLICEYDPFVAFFRLDGRFNLLLLGGSLLVISMFVGRPYCRFLCPYGVLLGWLAPLARWRIKIHPKQCIQCRMCEEACPFGAILPATPEPKPERRYEGRLRLAGLLFALPALVAAGAWLGRSGGDQLAQLNFTVALAGRIYAEEEKRVTGVTDESDAFRKQGGAPEELYAAAEAIKGRFRSGATAVGAFLGLVVGWQLVALSTRRRRTEYLADQSKCVACGRCYLACPGERERLGLVGVVEAK
jgi:ferredoxin